MKNKISKLLSDLIKNAKEIEDNITVSNNQSNEKIEIWAHSLKNKIQTDDSVFENKKNSLKQDAIEHWIEFPSAGSKRSDVTDRAHGDFNQSSRIHERLS